MDTIQNQTLTISNLETLRVISNPLRAQIMDLLSRQPSTVNQVAEMLGLAPGKLYYHFRLLEKHGLVEVTETRQVSNLIEKHYRAAARHIDVDEKLLNFSTPEGKENLNAMVLGTLESTRDDILRSLQARSSQLEEGQPEHPRTAMFNRLQANLTDEQAQAFAGRLKTVCEEFETYSENDSPDAHPYAISMFLFPSFYFSQPPASEVKP
jgi:DNA-binding transcriptional ArsR family regulator